MKPVLYLNRNAETFYDKWSFFGKLKDRLNTKLEDTYYVEDLKLQITNVKIPCNIHPYAYNKNLHNAVKMIKGNVNIAPRIYRRLDYNYYSEFQKKLSSFGVVNSIAMILNLKNKNIQSSCIAIYDSACVEAFEVIIELSKYCKYIILISENIRRTEYIRDYVTANYGISPVISGDLQYINKEADFIILTKDNDIISCNIPIWYLNNNITDDSFLRLRISDVVFNSPWDINNMSMGPELLGAILEQMQEKDVVKSLRYNGIYIDKILYNEKLINT